MQPTSWQAWSSNFRQFFTTNFGQKHTRFDAFGGEADGDEGPDEGDQPNGDGVGQVPAAI